MKITKTQLKEMIRESIREQIDHPNWIQKNDLSEKEFVKLQNLSSKLAESADAETIFNAIMDLYLEALNDGMVHGFNRGVQQAQYL